MPGESITERMEDEAILDRQDENTNRRHYSYVKFAQNGEVYGYVELVCDTADDIAYLPTAKTDIAVGSKCFCIEDGKTYRLSNAREWVVPGVVVEVAEGGSAEGAAAEEALGTDNVEAP